jgi:D-glycero-D-manno-heptose 1,7-bisphosphate phosphatase
MASIVLGRDGVINQRSEKAIHSPNEWIPITGSLEAIQRLNHAGFQVAVATNQPGLASGELDIAALNEIHQRLHQELDKLGAHLDAVFFCPHAPGAGCDCRKPRPGLLLEIGRRLGIDPDQLIVIGDTSADLDAARNAGAQPVLLRTGVGSRTEKRLPRTQRNRVRVYDDLASAVDALLKTALTTS